MSASERERAQHCCCCHDVVEAEGEGEGMAWHGIIALSWLVQGQWVVTRGVQGQGHAWPAIVVLYVGVALQCG